MQEPRTCLQAEKECIYWDFQKMQAWSIHVNCCEGIFPPKKYFICIVEARTFDCDTQNAYAIWSCCRLLGRTHFDLSEIISKGRESLNQKLSGRYPEMIEVDVPDLALYLHWWMCAYCVRACTLCILCSYSSKGFLNIVNTYEKNYEKWIFKFL